MQQTPLKEAPLSHYNDWPNTQGFDSHYEERTPVELRVEGQIPAYAAGTLFRTGLGPRKIETSKGTTFTTNHWFDQFSQVHRFQIHDTEPGSPTRVTYSSRLTSDGLIAQIKKTGKLDGFTFAAKYDPCKSFFRKFQSMFLPGEPRNAAPNEVNIGVTLSANFPGLSKTGEKFEGSYDGLQQTTLCAKTDAQVFQLLNPETLEPVGVADQSVLHPDLKGPGSAAHARSDPTTGDVYNYNVEFGRTGTYRVFKVSAATGKTSILATFPYAPAYLHSLFMTKNYVVLCVWNSFYRMGGASILWTRNLLEAMEWDGKRPTTWFVIDKRPVEEGGKGLVAVYESEAFFCFHTVNAYEEISSKDDGKIDIVADLAAYENLDAVHRFYMDQLISDNPAAHKTMASLTETVRPNFRRFRLPSLPSTPSKTKLTAVSEFTSSKENSPELPILNPRLLTKKYRYVYGISDTGKSSFVDSLIKYDTETNTVVRWSVQGHTPGEPIFIPDPASDDEDSGVLLAIVLDGYEGASYLLILDAKTMQQVAKAHVDGVVGFGFHGLHVKSREPVGKLNGVHL